MRFFTREWYDKKDWDGIKDSFTNYLHLEKFIKEFFRCDIYPQKRHIYLFMHVFDSNSYEYEELQSKANKSLSILQ